MKNLLTLSVLFVTLQVCFAQNAKYRVLSVPVVRNTLDLRDPWAGGLNSPQFSSIDLNHDNYMDLFVFDRVGDKVLTYLNNGNGTDSTYVYAPQYETLFPSDLNSWALIRDYNKDGIPDIFTHANAGSRVYKGSLEQNVLRFNLVSNLLSYTDGNYNVNIWTNIDDIPVFADVNGDGDIDVLSYGVAGSQIEYYENMTREHPSDIHYDIDSFKYLMVTICWGNVAQNSQTNAMVLNVTCKGNGEGVPSGSGSRHSGNTIFSFDYDNDHDVDLLNGNIGYDNLSFLRNGGDSSYANITQWDSLWPVCSSPILMPTYPAAYGVDVSGDGLEDLLISPNARSGGRDVKNVMFYKNKEGSGACAFELQSDTFLIHDQIDLGTDSKPVFFDFNGDGLKDIIVGNFGYFRPFTTYKSTIAYYENIGTATSPRFKQRTDDYNNFSTLAIVAQHPAFGDLDGDGLQDMLIGDLNGFLDFFKNTGGTVASFTSMTTPQYFMIDVGQYAAPFIYDLNGDSLLDILVGKKDGKISYYWNFGTRTSPAFSVDSVNTNFGGINVTQTGISEGYAQPVIWKNANGSLELFTGSYRGAVLRYQVDGTKLRGGSFTQLDSNFLKYDVGGKSAITIADINNDGLLEYVVGNSRGGLLMYSDSMWDASTLPLEVENIQPEGRTIKVYPNPARNYFVCQLEGVDLSAAKAEVFNILGEKVSPVLNQTSDRILISTADLSNGFYLVRITSSNKAYTGKILIEK